MRLENGRFLMQVEEKGAEITSLYDKAREKELIWDGDPAFWARHAPILFPHVGRTFEDVLRIGNRQYTSAQHGFARDRVFKADKLGDGQARFTLRHDEETLKKYPFPFVLSVTYTLHPSDVTVQWKVENPGQEDMPFTIGGHPAFTLPKGAKDHADCALWFPEKTELVYHLLDPGSGTVLADKSYPLPLENGVWQLHNTVFDHDALVFDGGQIEEVWLLGPGREKWVGMMCPGFPNFGVWAKPGAGFVCLEPWQGRCENCGYEGDFAARPGVVTLSPGGTFTKEYHILAP